VQTRVGVWKSKGFRSWSRFSWNRNKYQKVTPITSDPGFIRTNA